jgi:hypothetical protein
MLERLQKLQSEKAYSVQLTPRSTNVIFLAVNFRFESQSHLSFSSDCFVAARLGSRVAAECALLGLAPRRARRAGSDRLRVVSLA